MKTTIKKILLFLLSVAMIPLSGAAQEMRTFTSADGNRTFEGRLIDFNKEEGTVKVVRTSGAEVSFPLSTLSEEDRDYIMEQVKGLAEKKAMPFGPKWKPDSEAHPHDAQEECPVEFDFVYRDTLPQSDSSLPPEEWEKEGWGPRANTFPELKVPECVKDPVEWKRRRVVEVAKKYIGLPYMHKHVPAAGGLDCSNFTAWVYNYAFGMRFSSGVESQSESAGRQLDPDEKRLPGDLMFQTSVDGKSISHSVIYIGEIPGEDGEYLIDSTKGSVEIRPIKYWYVDRHSHSRRIIESETDSEEEN